ncbi:MAG: putative zinc-binding metallopeptidase, partial [Caldimonas sp.]
DAALKQHYAAPLADWYLTHISAYASSHPWEDWAECWAHYLHMVDGLETAAAWGLHLDHAVPNGPTLTAVPVSVGESTIAPSIVEQWLPVSQFCNAMNRSLGLHDSYPFVVRAAVVAKLEFIHRVIGAAARGEMPMNFSSPDVIEPVLDAEAAAAVGQMPPPEPAPPAFHDGDAPDEEAAAPSGDRLRPASP